MSFDKNMLTPQGLLVNGNFVLQGTSFTDLIVNINKMMSVLHTKQYIIDYFKFLDAMGMTVLVDILNDIIYLLDEINVEAGKLKVGYHDVGTLCDEISVLAAAAPKDYDEIFDGLARLYKDEAHNVELRNAVKTKIDARLTEVRVASSSATASRKVLADSTDAIDLALSQLQPLNQQLNRNDIYFRVLEEFAPNWILITLNFAAVDYLRVLIPELKLNAGTEYALRELQQAVGAIAEIDMDLISLRKYIEENTERKYIEENTEPGPNPILNLQKGTILEMWEELDREAKKSKSNFVDTA